MAELIISNNILPDLLDIANKKSLKVTDLGWPFHSTNMYLFENNHKLYNRSILIAAGFHGDEIAGSLAVLAYLNQLDPSTLSNVNLSILPLVNPLGWANKTRENDFGEDVNRGFSTIKNQSSKEGKILLNRLSMLINKSRHGFLSLHEDIDEYNFYMYSNERQTCPTMFTYDILEAGTIDFGISRNTDPDIGKMKNGIIFNEEDDGSFEDRLFNEGILRTVCTETPGLRKLEDRINTNVNIIKTFINYDRQ